MYGTLKIKASTYNHTQCANRNCKKGTVVNQTGNPNYIYNNSAYVNVMLNF